MEWVIQQLREAMPFGEQPHYLLRDNHGIFGCGVRAFLESCGIWSGCCGSLWSSTATPRALIRDRAGKTPAQDTLSGEGELISAPVAGGLHHRYYRAAA